MLRTLVQVTKFKEVWVVTEYTNNSSGYNDTSADLKQFETKSEAEAYKQELCSKRTYNTYHVNQKWILISQEQHYE